MTRKEIKEDIKELYAILIDYALEEGRTGDAEELKAEMKVQLRHWRTWR